MPAHTDPDAQLMLRVKRGDRAAFEELVEKYKQPVINMIYRVVPDAIEAEDLAQAVFVQVYKSRQRYKVTAKFSTWLFTIARNLAFNEIRRRSRHPAESLDATRPDNEDQPALQIEETGRMTAVESAIHTELEDKIAEAVRDLPDNQKMALEMCREEELSYEDMAEILGCSLSATKSLIHRARETLKARLKPYLQTGAWKGGSK